MYTEPIELWGAVITAVSHKLKDGVVATKITIQSRFDLDLAVALGAAALVFSEHGGVRGGFKSVDLSTGCLGFRALFKPDPALKQILDITGDETSDYCVEHADEALRLKFTLQCHSDPISILAYLLAVGTGESNLRITPLQQDLIKREPSAPAEHTPARKGKRLQ